MTGLNLETFLHLLRADLGAWVSLGLIAVALALMTWTSWGSRRALRKCLVLSIIAHFGLVLYGSTISIVRLAINSEGKDEPARDRIRRIKVTPWSEAEPADRRSARGTDGRGTEEFDRPRAAVALAETKIAPPLPALPAPEPARPKEADLAPEAAAPELAPPAAPEPEKRSPTEPEKEAATPPSRVAPGNPEEIAAAIAQRAEPEPEVRTLPDRNERLRAGPTESKTPMGRPSHDPSALPEVPKLTAPVLKAKVEARPETPAAPPVDLAPPDLTEPKGGEVTEPEIVRGGPSSLVLPLIETDLRERGRRAVTGTGPSPLPSPRNPAPRPPLALNPEALGAGTGTAGTAPPLERPGGIEPTASAAPAPVSATDPAASGVTTEVVKRPSTPLPRMTLPDPDIRRPSRPSPTGRVPALSAPRRSEDDERPLALARVTPSGVGRLPDVSGMTGSRPLSDIPEVYRSRLDPNRSALAQRAGASSESEQAVERALDWLKRHQDADGRWDAATARFDDGTIKKGDDDFTIHCPPGETCFGACLYWEADTALTGLTLLAYLGAGYTHADGKYAETVGKGIDFLVKEQKRDGDLRGPSRAVGMYCHAMATLALCEAYALSGDERLRAPVAKAIGFLTRARARDGMSWRYAPGEPYGDTSILGWAVLALKSAKIVGVPVPATMQTGTLAWLNRVEGGANKGLARYLPGKPVTPTMTAEAWVCRQFLGVGGPGPASAEAADYLLEHGPERDPYNLYYWYYGTLAMYQHGGDAWSRWNAQVRDQIVRRQRAQGHQAGSWDPDDSLYGTTGGRIYCTALATLTLEVYYRFLRLYEDPRLSPSIAPSDSPRRLGSRPQPGAG